MKNLNAKKGRRQQGGFTLLNGGMNLIKKMKKLFSWYSGEKRQKYLTGFTLLNEREKYLTGFILLNGSMNFIKKIKKVFSWYSDEKRQKYLTGFTLLNDSMNFIKKMKKLFSWYSGEKRQKYLTGFTLVEMITAVAIFSIVMTIALGSLLSIINANKQNQAIQTAVDNLDLALEMMSREIRVGYTYHCGKSGTKTVAQDCSSGKSYLVFEPYDGDPGDPNDQIVYKLETNPTTGAGRIKRSEDSDNSSLYLTAKNVHLEELKFYVVGADNTISANVDIQPRVLITVGGYVDLGSVGDRGKSYFNLQTTVSQRIIDF